MATVTQARVHVTNEAVFEIQREQNRLIVGGMYAVYSDNYDGGVLFAFSPDGIGCYWYDTRQDMLNEHG